jgi:transcription antitermination factor NusG
VERGFVKQVSRSFASFAVLIALVFHPQIGTAQAAAQRLVGTITVISADTLTIKSDSGEAHQVQVTASAVLKRVSPGQKDLSAAQDMQLSDLAIGDRILVKLDPNATGATPQAVQIIAIKQTNIAQKQQQDLSDWQRNGIGGLVKSVDAASGVVMVTTGAGPSMKTVTVHIGKSTVLKRYASNSIRFADAQPAPLDSIKAGDQFRARGQKNADGTEFDAVEVVSGSFRNISGTVVSIDAANSTLTVKDLITKKNVNVHITPSAQMRRLPDMMARMIAARLKGTAMPASGATAPARSEGAQATASGQPPAQGSNAPGGQGAGVRRSGGDMEQVLDRAPAVQLADLQKGEAVMLVSTEGASDVTAIKLLAGVEPLLESPEASKNLLANWSMGSGGGGADAAQ